MQPDGYKASEFYTLINASPPPLARIKNSLEALPPAELSFLLKEEPECVFLVDYYFRLFDPVLGAAFINAEDFDPAVAAELFNCQLIRYYRKAMHQEEEEYSSLMKSFWKQVRRDRLLAILKVSMSHSSMYSAALLLQEMDRLDFLLEEGRMQSEALLAFFKKQGQGLVEFLKSNPNLYDFIYKLAREIHDEDYLQFLDQFTAIIIELRIASTLAEEHRATLGPDKRLSMNDLVVALSEIPAESHRLTLEVFERKELIEPGIRESLLRFKKEDA